MSFRGFLLAAALVAPLMAAPAQAAGYIATYANSDCPGRFGSSLGSCTYDGASAIARYDYNEATGGFFAPEINNVLFPTFTGAEIALTPYIFGEEAVGVYWLYTMGVGDPSITEFAIRGGPSFSLYSTGGIGDQAFAPDRTDGSNLPHQVMHVTFYGTPSAIPVPVPEPTSVALFGIGAAGLLGMTRLRRRNNAA
jgi:hypothetical protein